LNSADTCAAGTHGPVLLTVSAVPGWEVTSTTAANTGATTLAIAAPPRL